MPKAISLVALSAGALSANDMLANMPANTWMSVPNSQMSQVCFLPAPKEQHCRYVTKAWNGGVYDQANRKMLVWGGGHGDYYGNEVYAFNTETLKWERLTNPSSGVIEGMDPLPDGQPVSRHTYDGLAYIANRGRMLAYGGATAGAGNGTSVTWSFDAASKKWENRSPSGTRPGGSDCCEFTSEFDPVSHKVFLRDPRSLWSYDYDQNVWKKLMDQAIDGSPRKSTADPKRKILFTIGSGQFLAYDIAAGKDVTSAWSTTGGSSPIGGYGPAMDYDWSADKLVVWVGGGPWVLDMETKAWTRMSGSGAPATPETAGTYGRFRYLEKENVFILVNTAEDNVYFYKHTAGSGSQRTSVGVIRPNGGKAGGRPLLEGLSQGAFPDVKVLDALGAEAGSGIQSAAGAYILVPARGADGDARSGIRIKAQ